MTTIINKNHKPAIPRYKVESRVRSHSSELIKLNATIILLIRTQGISSTINFYQNTNIIMKVRM
jgi:hypothetical protein